MVKLNNILLYLMALFGVVFLFFPNLHENKYIFLSIFSSIILALFVKKFIIKRYNFNKKFYFWVIFFLWVNLIGELWLYYLFIGLDKVSHFSAAIFITAMIYDYFDINLKVDRIFIVLSLIGALTLWEIFDYILYAYFGLNIMGVWINGVMILSPFEDTMRDIYYGIGGSITYIIFKKIQTKYSNLTKKYQQGEN